MKSILKRFLITTILKDTKATVIVCGCCGSPYTRFKGVNKYEYGSVKKVCYSTICSSCGAEGGITERWSK